MRELSQKLLYSEHLELDGNRIHISSDDPNDFEVWLNTDAGDFDGLCIGCGPTREIAVSQAIAIFKEGLTKLGSLQTKHPDYVEV